MIETQRVNIAILTYNGLEQTKKCIERIGTETKSGHNIFVFDNGSTDGTAEYLKESKLFNLIYQISPRNLGVPGGRNQLIQMATQFMERDGFLVFLDNDMLVSDSWDKSFLAVLDRRPDVGILSGRGHKIKVHKLYRELLPQSQVIHEVDVACGGYACWIRAQTLMDVGLFDENLGLFWHEDDDYSVRAIAKGWEVWQLPDVPLIHEDHSTGVAKGGNPRACSPANQKYLVDKWRKMGMVDPIGNIIRVKDGAHSFMPYEDDHVLQCKNCGMFWQRRKHICLPYQDVYWWELEDGRTVWCGDSELCSHEKPPCSKPICPNNKPTDLGSWAGPDTY